ncbi:MAG: glycosyltransferase [candidate division Zixibacteria bacterium]|nr:glycosyltransferase [candidate division Zixibacteria bacterium]
MDFSIVTSLYYSAPYLEEFYSRICAEVEKVSNDCEIIFVNDGSPDNSLELAISFHENDHRVKVIDLSRNFGHHTAVLTGLANARGSYVFLIDCDLEEEPELFGKFFQKMQETHADVVFGIQKRRKGELFERLSGGIFWRLFNLLSSYPVPGNQLMARLMAQQYVRSLLEYRECEVYLPGMWALTGFRQIPLAVTKHSKGRSTYTLRKKIAQFVTAITSFSTTPLVFIFYLGAVIAGISSISALWLILKRVFFGVYLAGWPSLIVSIWLLGGLTIFCLGLIGIYLSKVFVEAKQRPRGIIRRIYEQGDPVKPEIKTSLSGRPPVGEQLTDHMRSVGIMELSKTSERK